MVGNYATSPVPRRLGALKRIEAHRYKVIDQGETGAFIRKRLGQVCPSEVQTKYPGCDRVPTIRGFHDPGSEKSP